MLAKRTMGARGQIVVPKDMRDQFGFREGSEIAFEAKDEGVLIKQAKTPEEFLKEFFTSSKRINVKDGAKWIKRVIDKQYEEEYRDILRR